MIPCNIPLCAGGAIAVFFPEQTLQAGETQANCLKDQTQSNCLRRYVGLFACDFAHNTAVQGGGHIFVRQAPIVISNSSFASNTARPPPLVPLSTLLYGGKGY